MYCPLQYDTHLGHKAKGNLIKWVTVIGITSHHIESLYCPQEIETKHRFVTGIKVLFIHATLYGFGCGSIGRINLSTVASETTFILLPPSIISIQFSVSQRTMVLHIEVHFQSSSCLGIAWIHLTIERTEMHLRASTWS